MTPLDVPLAEAPDENWIGAIKPYRFTSKSVHVRPGPYRVSAYGCEQAFTAYVSRVEVDGPTKLTLTPTNDPASDGHDSPAPGYHEVVVPVIMSQAFLNPPQPEAQPPEETAPVESTNCDPPGTETMARGSCCSGEIRELVDQSTQSVRGYCL